MNKKLAILCFVLGIVMMIFVFPEGFAAAILVLLSSLVAIFGIKSQKSKDVDYLIQLFLVALIVRLIFGLIVQVFDLRGFFGNDAILYDLAGERLADLWRGYNVVTDDYISAKISGSPSGWGMFYFVGCIYFFTGKNIYAAQSICAVVGAATVPLVYRCAYSIFNNRRVGKISALLVAFYPAFIIWSGQLLKDGLIIFLLVLSMLMVLRLQEKFSYVDVLFLILSLSAIISLRFYIFYMAALAIVGAFIVGHTGSSTSIVRRMIALAIIGIAFTYFGVIRNASNEVGEFADLERIERSRQDLSTANSGYGEDLDVSTTEGALAALPVGFTYLMLAPFPWQINNLRQLITLPEVLLWWLSIPFMLSGLLYTIRTRLRKSVAILVFSVMLSLAYSLFLGNVGTAYRQRTQIQVFLFMFIAVGWTLRMEKQENRVQSLK